MASTKREKPENGDDSKSDIPWLSIVTSLTVWAILVSHFASNFGSYILQSYLPLYLFEELHYNLKEASGISAIPSIGCISKKKIFNYFQPFLSGGAPPT